MYVVIHPYVLGIICVVFLRCQVKKWGEGGVPKKGSDAFDNVSVINFTHFVTNRDHVALKTRTAQKIFINDSIQLPRIIER